MPNPHHETIMTTLWPANMRPWSKICAVLDCARDERIYDLIERCHLDKCCLYAGRLPMVVQRAAPHLVVLDREDRFTRQLVEEGWGNNWGSFFRTEASMLDVRRHLRTLFRVKDETGRILIFRWYDPRVLRAYLPTCLPNELHTFFGPIERFYCEGEQSGSMMQFGFDGQDFLHRLYDLSSRDRALKQSLE
jgi:hypothetical protein